MDAGTASIVVALITVIGAPLIGLWVEQRRQRRELQGLNRSVNGVPEGTPTLIQRVALLERRSDMQTRWLIHVLGQFAHQLGVKLPPPPEEDKAA